MMRLSDTVSLKIPSDWLSATVWRVFECRAAKTLEKRLDAAHASKIGDEGCYIDYFEKRNILRLINSAGL